MPSFADSAIIFVLALLLFGPEKLPKLARELGKWIGEFRRASNEFKMQMEDELRLAEQAEREKKLAAIEATAPAPAPLPASTSVEEHAAAEAVPETSTDQPAAVESEDAAMEAANEVEPIATSGDLNLMPPATGLPVGRSGSAGADSSSIAPLLDSIPVVESAHIETPQESENAAHG